MASKAAKSSAHPTSYLLRRRICFRVAEIFLALNKPISDIPLTRFVCLFGCLKATKEVLTVSLPGVEVRRELLWFRNR